jgi:hypothetical protein
MLAEANVPLTPETQLRIAAWAMKTALMADFLVSPSSRHFPPRVYAQFFRDRQPSDNHVTVRTGAYAGLHPALTRNTAALTVETDVSFNEHGILVPVPKRYSGVMCTLRVWRAVFQIIAVNAPDSALRHYGDGKIVHRIWPREAATLMWPPNNKGFDDGGFRAFMGKRGSTRVFRGR